MEHRTQSAIFRTEWAKNAARTMLDVIKAITKRSKLITGLALGASTPHQMLYLIAACIPHMHLDSLQGKLDALGMVLIAVVVPIVADLTIYTCIDTLGAQAASRSSKLRALLFMIIPLGASGYVNFLAPAPMLLKGLAAFLVAMIMIAQGLRFIEADWQQLEDFETRNVVIEDVLDEPARPKRPPVTEREKRARRRDFYDAMTNTERYKWRTAWRIKETARLAREVEDSVPVSPAPAGLSVE